MRKLAYRIFITGAWGIALIGGGLSMGCSGSTDTTQAGEVRGVSSPSEVSLDGAADVAFDARSDDIESLRQNAAEKGRYLFVFFWKEADKQTAEMRAVFDAALANMADRADAAVVRLDDPQASGVVSEYGLERAPMPLVLAIAPNGAITGGFPTEFSATDLEDAFASPRMSECLKALQAGKLVFLCVQNDNTKENESAMRGVSEFKSDGRFRDATEVVMLDPADDGELAFLKDLEIDPGTAEAVTVLLAPPGAAVAKFSGATSKDVLVQTLLSAGSACGPGGCGPGGCAPQ